MLQQAAIGSEAQRTLQPLDFAPGQVLSRNLPLDTVYKSIQIRLSGSVVTTFASGTPVSDAQSIFDNLVNRIEVVVNGSRTIKSVRPHLLRMQQLFTTTIQAERRASAGATAALDNLPTVDGGFVYGTTGQITTVAESVTLSFEMVYCDPGMGREATYLNLKGQSSAELKISTSQFASLLGRGNTAPVVYSGSTLKFDIVTREAQDVPVGLKLSDWRQTTKVVQFSSEQRNVEIPINKGQYLTGIMLFAQDGAPGSPTTATGKLASNLLITNMSLVLNGNSTRKTTKFPILQAENRTQYGINAPLVGGVSILDGVAHMNLLSRKDIATALPVMQPLVDNVQLFVDTNSSANVNYSTPGELTIMTEELVPA